MQRGDNSSDFQTLLSCLNEWSVNASSVIVGEAVVFDDFPPSVDSIHASLFAPSEHNTIVEEIILCFIQCILISAGATC